MKKDIVQSQTLKTTTQTKKPTESEIMDLFGMRMRGEINPKIREAYQNKIISDWGEFKMVPVEDLINFDDNRLPKADDLKKYVKQTGGIDPRLLGVLNVGQIEGTDSLIVFDGGHRLALVKNFAPSIKELPCYIVQVPKKEVLNMLFTKMNGFSSKNVNSDQRFINMVKGEMFDQEPTLRDQLYILDQTGVVVWDHKDLYIDDTKQTQPQFKISASALRDLVNDVDSAIWAVNTYTSVFASTRKKTTDDPSAISAEVVKALQCIKTSYDNWDLDDWSNYDYTNFVNWFKSRVALEPSPSDHTFTDTKSGQKHERIEKRNTGTAVGLVKKFNKYAEVHCPGSRLPAYVVECAYYDVDWKREAKKTGASVRDIRQEFVNKARRSNV